MAWSSAETSFISKFWKYDSLNYSQLLHFCQKLLLAELRAFQICWVSWIHSLTLKSIFKYDDGRVEIELLFLAYSKKLNKGPQ